MMYTHNAQDNGSESCFEGNTHHSSHARVPALFVIWVQSVDPSPGPAPALQGLRPCAVRTGHRHAHTKRAGSNYSSVTQDREGLARPSVRAWKSPAVSSASDGLQAASPQAPNRPRSQWRWSWCRAALLDCLGRPQLCGMPFTSKNGCTTHSTSYNPGVTAHITIPIGGQRAYPYGMTS